MAQDQRVRKGATHAEDGFIAPLISSSQGNREVPNRTWKDRRHWVSRSHG